MPSTKAVIHKLRGDVCASLSGFCGDEEKCSCLRELLTAAREEGVPAKNEIDKDLLDDILSDACCNGEGRIYPNDLKRELVKHGYAIVPITGLESNRVEEAAKYLAETVMRYDWNGLSDRPRSSQYPPWKVGGHWNAHKDDYRAVVHTIAAIFGAPDHEPKTKS